MHYKMEASVGCGGFWSVGEEMEDRSSDGVIERVSVSF